MRSRVIKLSPTLASVLETDVLDHVDDDVDDGFTSIREAARQAWNEFSLVVDADNEERLARALTDLANHCDELAETRELDGDDRKFYRRASLGFTTLVRKIRRRS